jgi:tetratricopeptide (TPR) repeat protein
LSKPLFPSLLIWIICLAAAGQGDPTSALQLFRQAQEARERFQFETAKDFYEQIIALEPDDPNHYVEISKLWIGLDDVEQSRKSLERALELSPYHPDALSLLAIYYQDEKQDLIKAQELLQLSSEHHSEHVQSQTLLLEIYIQLRQLDKASQLVDSIHPGSKPDGYIDYQKAVIAFVNHDFDTALRLFQAAENMDYKPLELHRYLAQVYHQKQDSTQAQYHQQQFQKLKQIQNERKQLWQLLRLQPNDAGRWFALGIHYLSNDDLEHALPYLEKGIEIDPSQEKILSLAGKIALRLKQPKRAVPFISKALEINGNSMENWNNLGVCHMLNRDYPSAVHAFEQSIQHGNSNPQVRQNLELAKSKL